MTIGADGSLQDDPALFRDLLEALRTDGAMLAVPAGPEAPPLLDSAAHFHDEGGRNSLGLLEGDTAELLDALYAPVLALDESLSLSDADGARSDPSGDAEGAADDRMRQLQSQSPTPHTSLIVSAAAAAAAAARPGRPKSRPSADKGKAKRRPRLSNPNKAREERRRELLYLRGQVAEMERQVSSLQATNALRASRPQDGGALLAQRREHIGHITSVRAGADAGDQAADAVGLTEVWRQMCLRQLDRRIKAERENARLKRAVANQLKVSTAIQKLMQKPASINEATDVFLRKRMADMNLLPSDPAADRELFAELIAEVDAAIHKVDAFFEDNGLLNVDAPRRGTHMRESDGRLVMDVFATSVLPFDWQFTGRGVWEFYRGVQKHYGPIYEKMAHSIGPSEDTVLENFIMEVTASNACADFRFRQVVKRFSRPDQLVIVWTNDSQPVERTTKSTDFGCFRETGFVVCRPPRAGGAAASAQATTVIQVGYRVSPYTPHAVERQVSARANISDIAQFVFTSYDAEICLNLERVENLLFDEQRRQ